MSRLRHLLAGSLVTLAVTGAAAVLSAAPDWRRLPDDVGVVSLSFSHGGARSCRELSAAERAKLPANMRRTTVCDRARAALRLELDIDGAAVLRSELAPGGLAGDGPAHVYRRFVLPAGEHALALRLADSGRATGFDHAADQRVRLAPGQNLVIDFRPERGGFVFE